MLLWGRDPQGSPPKYPLALAAGDAADDIDNPLRERGLAVLGGGIAVFDLGPVVDMGPWRGIPAPGIAELHDVDVLPVPRGQVVNIGLHGGDGTVPERIVGESYGVEIHSRLSKVVEPPAAAGSVCSPVQMHHREDPVL